jgi:hypothetical protein
MNDLHLPEIRVGEPVRCGALAVYPLFAGLPLFPEGDGTCDYALAHEAMATGTLIVQEVSEEGSVCELMAENIGDRPVLFVEGEEMKGAKQNRAVASSIMVAGRSQARISVCCIQRGKWEYSSRQFSPGSYCPPTLRYLLKQGGYGGSISQQFDRQASVWQEIRRKHQATGTRSERENMSDTLDVHRDRVEALRGGLPYREGASGIAVTMDGKVVCLDIFNKPSTLANLWDRMVEGIALDALEMPDTGCQACGMDISVRLYKKRVWRQVDSVGLGEAYRATDDDSLATALVVDGVPIHVSMSMPTMG